MSDLSDWAENAALLWLAGKTPPTQPTEWNVALYDGDPTDSGTGTEVSQGDYNQITTAPADWTVTGSQATNDNNLDFGVASSDWDLFDHFAIIDQNGNIIGAGQLDKQYDVDSGESVEIGSGNATVELK